MEGNCLRGLASGTPSGSKWRSLAVRTVRPRAEAVAAMAMSSKPGSWARVRSSIMPAWRSFLNAERQEAPSIEMFHRRQPHARLLRLRRGLVPDDAGDARLDLGDGDRRKIEPIAVGVHLGRNTSTPTWLLVGASADTMSVSSRYKIRDRFHAMRGWACATVREYLQARRETAKADRPSPAP